MKINHYNEIHVGGSYKITWPNYDDYEETLIPEISKVKILSRYTNSFLVQDLVTDDTYEINFKSLIDTELEKI